jgi:hypothetical protein
MTLLTRRISWVLIAAIAAVLTLALFTDTTAPAEAHPSETAQMRASSSASPIFVNQSDVAPGRKRK